MAGELEALGLAAGQRGHRLTQPQVFETDGGQRLETRKHVLVASEELDGLGYRHLENLGNAARGALVAHHLHLEHFRPVAPTVAVRAAQVNVRQELHLDVFEAVTAAGRTTPVARVEAERTHRIAALDRDGLGGEALANRIERADVARRIRARCSPDRRLVDEHDFSHMLRASERAVRARRLGRLALGPQQRRVQHVSHQGRLARPRHTGHADQAVERDVHVEVAQVVLRRALETQARRPGPRRPSPPERGHHVAPAGEVIGGERVRASRKVGGRALEYHATTAFARSRPKVEDAIGGQHDLGIMLDDQQRVAVVPQPLHHLDDASHVARMQTDRRLIEHEERIDERRTERGGEIDALHLAARERARLPIERQVPEPHPDEEVEPRSHLTQEKIGRLVERRRKHESGEELPAALDGQQHQLVHAEAAR